MKFKFILSTLLVTCLSAYTTLNAQTQAPKKNPIPYDADLFRRDEPVFSFHGSFLFWRVQEGTNDYALKQQYTAPTGINTYAMGKYKTATYNGEPGFRLAASYFRAPKYWEIWGQYTRLTARGEKEVHTPENANEYIVATWALPTYADAQVPLSHASSSVHLNYNTADLVVDRFFNPNPHLRIRLVGGGTIAWINHDLTINYTNTREEKSQVHEFWKYIGGGMKIGTMIDWFCGWDLYITTSFTGATLLGTYKNNVKQTFSGQTNPIRDGKYSDVRPTFCFQTIVGPSWQKNFSSTRWEVFAGYELNTWFNLSETYRSSGGTAQSFKETFINSSLLALQGLTARASVDF